MAKKSVTNVRISLGVSVMLCALAASASCSSATDGPTASSTQMLTTGAAPPGDFRADGLIEAGWNITPGTYGSTSPLLVTLINTGATPLTVTLAVRAFGLDQRWIKRTLGAIPINPGTANFAIPANFLPVQSVGTQSQAVVELTLNNVGGILQDAVVTQTLDYTWDATFSNITVYGLDSTPTPPQTPQQYFGVDANGNVKSTATQVASLLHNTAHTLLSPQGQFWNGSAFTNVVRATHVTDSHSRHFGTTVLTGAYPGIFHGVVPNHWTPAAPLSQVCTTWLASFRDSNRGEDIGITAPDVEGPMYTPAPFAYAQLMDDSNGAAVIWSGNLDANGCTPPVPMNVGNSFVLWQDSILRGNGNPQQCVAADTNGGFTNGAFCIGYDPLQTNISYYYDIFNDVASVHTRYLAIGTAFQLTSSGTVTLNPTWIDSTTRTAFVLSDMVKAPDLGIGATAGWRYQTNRTCPPHTFGVGDNVCDITKNNGPCSDACYCPANDSLCAGDFMENGENTVFLGPTPSYTEHNTLYKFIIAHESGHAVQFNGGAVPGPGFSLQEYDRAGGAPITCDCQQVIDPNNRQHCLQSWQAHESAAQTEGWAHFIASHLWNSPTNATPTFVYYKQFLPAGSTNKNQYKPPPYSVAMQTPVRWLFNQCSGAPGPEQGVEYDWVEFFYSVNSGSNASSVQDLMNIYQTWCGGTCNGAIDTRFADLQSAASTYYGSLVDPRYLKFSNNGATYGVND